MAELDILRAICRKGGTILYDVLADMGPAPLNCLDEMLMQNPDMFSVISVDGEKVVLAKSSIRLCENKDCKGCEDLHMCSLYLFRECSEDGFRCPFSHELKTPDNITVLKKHGLEGLNEHEIATLLFQNDHRLKLETSSQEYSDVLISWGCDQQTIKSQPNQTQPTGPSPTAIVHIVEDVEEGRRKNCCKCCVCCSSKCNACGCGGCPCCKDCFNSCDWEECLCTTGICFCRILLFVLGCLCGVLCCLLPISFKVKWNRSPKVPVQVTKKEPESRCAPVLPSGTV